jgi:hypothetical protein
MKTRKIVHAQYSAAGEFTNRTLIFDIFGAFPVSFMKNVTAVFEKPIMYCEKPIKYQKSENGILLQNDH